MRVLGTIQEFLTASVGLNQLAFRLHPAGADKRLPRLQPAELPLGTGVRPFLRILLYEICSSSIALVLLISAGLKARALLSQSGQLSLRQTMDAVAIPTAWFVGAWLLSGLGALWARRASTALLAVFLAVSTWRWLTGLSDCGCFGAWTVRPATTVGFDVVAFATLILFRCPSRVPGTSPQRLHGWQAPSSCRLTAAVITAVLLPAAAVVYSIAPYFRSSADDAILVTAPQEWVGRTLPIISEIRMPGAQSLWHGKRTLVVYDHGCEHCQAVMRTLRGKACSSILLDIGSDSDDRAMSGIGSGVVSHFSPRVRWAAAVPTIIELDDGVTTRVTAP